MLPVVELPDRLAHEHLPGRQIHVLHAQPGDLRRPQPGVEPLHSARPHPRLMCVADGRPPDLDRSTRLGERDASDENERRDNRDRRDRDHVAGAHHRVVAQLIRSEG